MKKELDQYDIKTAIAQYACKKFGIVGAPTVQLVSEKNIKAKAGFQLQGIKAIVFTEREH